MYISDIEFAQQLLEYKYPYAVLQIKGVTKKYKIVFADANGLRLEEVNDGCEYC
jgi:hypothetical protein